MVWSSVVALTSGWSDMDDYSRASVLDSSAIREVHLLKGAGKAYHIYQTSGHMGAKKTVASV